MKRRCNDPLLVLHCSELGDFTCLSRPFEGTRTFGREGLKDWKMTLETPVAPPQSAAPAPRARGRVRTAVVLGLAVALVYGVSNPSVVGFVRPASQNPHTSLQSV